MKFKKIELSANQQAMAGIVKFFVALIICGVALYGDIMFIQVMWSTFPDGIGKILSLVGALATGLSVLMLVLAEAYWFTRGPQMVVGWIFTAAEVAVSVSNATYAYLQANHTPLGYFAVWQWVVPATPFLAFVGWIVILNLDQGQTARHEQREMESKLAKAELAHQKEVHASLMELRSDYLQSHTTHLQAIRNSPVIQQGLERGAWELAMRELQALTGMYIAPPSDSQLPALPASQPNQVTGHLEAVKPVGPEKEEEDEKISLSLLLQELQRVIGLQPLQGGTQPPSPLADPLLYSIPNQQNHSSNNGNGKIPTA